MNSFFQLGINVDQLKGGNQKTTCPKCSSSRKNKIDRCLSVNIEKETWFCHHCGWSSGLKNGNGHQPKNIIATYDYRDELGELLFQKVRYEPKGFSVRRPDGKDDWIFNLSETRRVLYLLPELISSSGLVFIVGGEKDADNLADQELTSTTNFDGEGKWNPDYNAFFKGRDVVILEDNDEKGRKHGQLVLKNVLGIAQSIKIIRFSDLSKGGDVTDYLAKYTKDDLLTLVESRPLFNGSYSEHFSDTNLIDQIETWNQIRDMDIKVEWVVDRLIPKESITVLFGKGGIGKTWLMMDMARCIGSGIDYLGYETRQTPVIFVDFENPVAVLNTRTQRLGEAEGVHFWRVGNELKPPKLDSPEWEQYKELPEESVLVFDTLRASQSGDENDSRDMAEVMNRMKELRDMGFTIILLHHTAKNTDKVSKGSTAIVDLADHILGLTRVRQKEGAKDTLVDDDADGFDTEAVYYFGNYEKTRFEPHHVHLKLNPDRGFELAPDPEEQTLKKMHQVLQDSGPLQKTAFKMKVSEVLDIGQKKAKKLVDRGAGRFWKIEAEGKKNAQLVTAIQFGSSATPIESDKLPNCPGDELEPEKQGSFVL
jgi:hypothetical protein